MQSLGARFRDRLGSLVWRMLTGYGRVKYRYLLPAYRLLGMLPNEIRPAGTAHPSRTLRGAQAVVRLLNRRNPEFYRKQLSAVINRAREARGAVIFLPSVGWGIVNTQRTHHLAREFARQGFISIFDCTNTYDDVDGFKEIEPNLFLFRADGNLLAEMPSPLLWSLSYNFDRTDDYPRGTRVVYDWIDDLEVFPYDRAFLDENHRRALKEATVVVSVARRLHEQAVAARPDAVYLPNAVEYGRFATDKSPVPDDSQLKSLLDRGKPMAGYYGALADWFDYELLGEVADLRPDWSFLLIGPAYDLSARSRGRLIFRRPNIKWVGSREYRDLPSYLQLFDVAIIPFIINDITLATSPLKLYEYFAGGKPVVATPMPECEAFPEVHIARDVRQFSQALDLARSEGRDQHFIERARALARMNSWATRVETLVEHLNGRSTEGSKVHNSFPRSASQRHPQE